jgi:hypothetical protein
MKPTDRDLADFAQLGLRYGLLTPKQIQAWADRVLLERAEVPTWAVELSIAELNEMIHLLGTVPGQTTGDLHLCLLTALIYRQWRSGDLSLQRVMEVGWRLHLEDRLPHPPDGGDWGVVLYCQYEEFEQGYRSEAELNASVQEKLDPYGTYEGGLPDWT